jgi:hypothetical protein
LLKNTLKASGYEKISLGPSRVSSLFPVRKPNRCPAHGIDILVESVKHEKFDLDYISIHRSNTFLTDLAGGDNGFRLIENFLSDQEMAELVMEIDKGEWRPDLESKKVQVFGYEARCEFQFCIF